MNIFELRLCTVPSIGPLARVLAEVRLPLASLAGGTIPYAMVVYAFAPPRADLVAKAKEAYDKIGP